MIPEDGVVVSESDRKLIESVEHYRRAGVALKAWYDRVFRANSFADTFELARQVNRPGRSFGFFDEAVLPDGPMAVMGNYQEMFYDDPGAYSDFGTVHRLEWRDEVREFVLRYFMRVSSFTQPESRIGSGHPNPSNYRGGLSWCPADTGQREGFGFSQLYYKSAEDGQIYKFSAHEQFAIVDLRELGTKYEWVLLKVKIYDFKFGVQPFGTGTPEVSFDLDEDSYLVITRDFVVAQDDAGGGRNRYGFGYAFVKNQAAGLTAYGPGEFDAAFESIVFDIAANGTVTVAMDFVANRPTAVTNVKVRPVGWSLGVADFFSLGLASKLFSPVTKALADVSVGSFDPVYTYVSLANFATAGQAGDMLCISREQLDKRFLLQHFSQHYQTIAGSLVTWRLVPDWRAAAAIPSWIVTGGLING